MQEDDFGMDIGLGEEPGQSKDKIEEEYYFEVRTPFADQDLNTSDLYRYRYKKSGFGGISLQLLNLPQLGSFSKVGQGSGSVDNRNPGS